jgi:hypothetical protein
VEVLVKISLDHWEKPTRRAAFTLLAAAWMLCAGPVTFAAAQDGPGLRAGVSADPDQFFIGGHYVTRPIWDRLRFQPNVEAGFGDDATVVAFNAEFGFWMRLNAGWNAYFGGGPAVNVVSRDGKDGTGVEPGVNVLAGIRYRSGLFFEMKVGAIDSPEFKLAVGYTFR